MTGEEMVTAHHILGPSKSHRWLNCTGSIQFDTPGPESIWAEDGHHAHAVLSLVLKGEIVSVGQEVEGIRTTALRIDQAIEVRDFVRQWREAHPDFVIESEQPVAVSEALGLQRGHMLDGTADVIAYNEKEALVLDAKFGFVRVYPEKNSQLYLYAIGLCWELKKTFGNTPEFITVIIGQPDYEGVMQFLEHRMAYAELEEWYLDNRVKLDKAYLVALQEEQPEFNASDDTACRYCPGRNRCDERLSVIYKFAQEEWRITKTLKDLLPLLPQIKAIAKDLENEAMAQLAAGQPVPGFKLVEKSSIRKWGQSDQVIKDEGHASGLQVTESRVLSPAQIEKRNGPAGKLFTARLAIKPRGGPKLVVETDPRPEFRPGEISQEEIDALVREE